MWLKLCQLGLESYDRKRETKTVGVVLCSCDGVLSRPNPMIPFYTDSIAECLLPLQKCLCLTHSKPHSPGPISSVGF